MHRYHLVSQAETDGRRLGIEGSETEREAGICNANFVRLFVIYFLLSLYITNTTESGFQCKQNTIATARLDSDFCKKQKINQSLEGIPPATTSVSPVT